MAIHRQEGRAGGYATCEFGRLPHIFQPAAMRLEATCLGRNIYEPGPLLNEARLNALALAFDLDLMQPSLGGHWRCYELQIKAAR